MDYLLDAGEPNEGATYPNDYRLSMDPIDGLTPGVYGSEAIDVALTISATA